MPEGLNYIRPPNEQHSAIVRAVYGCSWNKCKFCGIYDALGVEAADRPVSDVVEDIHRARETWGADAESVFIGDADPMRMPPDDFVTVLKAVREAFPEAERVTCYARLATAWVRRAHLPRFFDAGLTRVHAGLETGSEKLLRFHRKGVSARRAVQSSHAIQNAGLELSLYVLLGVGGLLHEDEHVVQTANVLNAARPDFVRFRRLWVHDDCRLRPDIDAGTFQEQTPEGTVRESRGIVEGIGFACQLEALHHNVHCRFAGPMPQKQDDILKRIDKFLARPEERKNAVYERPSVI